MNEPSLTIFIDEFGNISQHMPIENWGWGFFVCYDRDAIFLNNQLKENFYETIHLMKSSDGDKLKKLLRKISSFLAQLKEKYYAGGMVFSDPQAMWQEIIRKGGFKESDIDKNYNFENFISLPIQMICAALANYHMEYTTIYLRFVFSVSGNYKDFMKRLKHTRQYVLNDLARISAKLNKVLAENPQIPRRPQTIIEIGCDDGSSGVRLIELADVFAHITNRCTRPNPDSFSNELYDIIKHHFNLFDVIKDHSTIVRRGIVDLNHDPTLLNMDNEVEYIKRHYLNKNNHS